MFGGKKDDADCPLWRAPCKEHKCRWYVQVQGHNPNTGVMENRWDCAVAWFPFLMIENSQQQRQTGASADKVANEVKKLRDIVSGQNADIQRRIAGPGDDQ